MVLLRVLLVYANIIGQRLEERRKVGMPEIAPPILFENKTVYRNTVPIQKDTHPYRDVLTRY